MKRFVICGARLLLTVAALLVVSVPYVVYVRSPDFFSIIHFFEDPTLVLVSTFLLLVTQIALLAAFLIFTIILWKLGQRRGELTDDAGVGRFWFFDDRFHTP